jgi:hypothetical protein
VAGARSLTVLAGSARLLSASVGLGRLSLAGSFHFLFFSFLFFFYVCFYNF